MRPARGRLRMLVTSYPTRSHVMSLVPISWALLAAGHDVRFAVLANARPAVEEAGLPALVYPAEFDPSRLGGRRFKPAVIQADLVRDVTLKAGLLAHGVREMLDAFRPDLVLYEQLDLAGPLIAQYLEVPAVHVAAGPPYHANLIATLRRGAESLRKRWGLDPARPPALVLDVCPPSYRDPGPSPLSAPLQPMRFVPFNGPGAVPGWLHQLAAQPRVSITLGADGVSDVSPMVRVAQVVHRLSPEMDIVIPASATPAPPTMAALREAGARVFVGWLPLKLLFAVGCDLAIHHGGPGSVLTALSFGLPQLVLRDRTNPARADHYITGRLLGACGAGQSLSEAKATDEELAQALRLLLTQDGFRLSAGGLAAEMAAQPSPAEVADLLAELALRN
jgi:UDP:flavonoid glycosyltransferase YjiC (YdhE family)